MTDPFAATVPQFAHKIIFSVVEKTGTLVGELMIYITFVQGNRMRLHNISL